MNSDAFISGLRAIFDADPSLKPATICAKANLDKSTIRKMLDGSSVNPKIDTLRKIAAALDTTIEAIAQGRLDPAPHQPPGMAEPITPFTFRPAAIPADSDSATVLRAILGTGVRNPQTWVAETGYPSFGILRGDMIVADLSRLPEPGELAVVTIDEDQSGTGHWTLRRFLPPYIIAGDPSDAAKPDLLDDHRIIVRAAVVGLIRGASH